MGENHDLSCALESVWEWRLCLCAVSGNGAGSANRRRRFSGRENLSIMVIIISFPCFLVGRAQHVAVKDEIRHQAQ